jgi:ribosomal protein S27AE
VNSLRKQTPDACPKCGYDPDGDDDEWVSGGGWSHSVSASDGIWVEELSCHRCGNVVASIEKRPEGR